ncbi:MAG: DNRLRE domain-containing protein [Bacteroidetes bacterium]|nr:DNRLRE domain-containing protein [Bacteroidota bacterium]
MNCFFINKNLKRLQFGFIFVSFCLFLFCGTAMADCTETFSWIPNAESNITGYKIYYGQVDNGPYPNIVDVDNPELLDGRIYGTVTGLTCGEQYYFVCVAVNEAGIESGYSDQVIVTPPDPGDTTPPLPPESVSGTIVNENILLTWQANSEADILGYRVYYGTSSRNYGLPISEESTEYSITGLDTDVTYYFAVTAVDTAGNESGYSSPEIIKIITDTTPDTIAPVVVITIPTSELTYGIESDTINIGGTASDTVGVVQVSWVNSTGGSGIASGTDTWSVSGLSLTEGENVIRITASDAAGNDSVDTITIIKTVNDLSIKTFGEVTGADFPETCEDTYLNVGAVNTNNSENSVSLNTYTWPTDTVANRIVMNWNIENIPQDVVISKATLSLYMFGYDGSGGDNDYEITAHRIINNNPIISQCTWNTFDGAHNWTGANNGGELDLASADDNVVIDKNTGYKEFDITQMVKEWVDDPSTNFGLMLNSDSTAASDSNRYFRPTEYSNPDMRPKLVVEYYGSGAVPSDTTPPVVAITSPTTGTTFNTETASLDIGGTASDATGVTQVSWVNLTGGSGIASGTDTWSVSGVSLAEGANIITITARDAAGNEEVDNITVTYTISDTTAPSIVISSPTSDTSYNTEIGNITLSGAASDNKVVTQVSWVNSTGGNGIASGTDTWSVSGLSLTEGENIITITASDAAGNESIDQLAITYQPNLSNSWTIISENDFESGWGDFKDGGIDCRRNIKDSIFAHNGNYCIRIRDNSRFRSSFKFATGMDVDTPNYTEIKIEFWYYPKSMETGEDFFVEYHDGNLWREIGRYIRGTHFENNSFYHENELIIKESATLVFPRNMRIRFRCDASSNHDIVYIDDVTISAR